MVSVAVSSCPTHRLAKVSTIISDMDGTWIGTEHKPTEGGVAAIKEAEDEGLLFCFATGRCPLSALEMSCMPSLAKRPGIYSNGAVVLGEGGALLYSLDIAPAVVERVVKLVLDHQDSRDEDRSAVLLNDCDTFYIAGSDKSRPPSTYALHLHEVYGDPKPIAAYPETTIPRVQLIHIVGKEEDIDHLHPLVAKEVEFDNASVSRNLPTDLVVTCQDAHKGFAIKKLMESLKLAGDCCCIGDSGNDVTMLRAADIGVAMKNARPETIAAAEFITANTNAEGELPGVLEVVRLVCESRQAEKSGDNKTVLENEDDAAKCLVCKVNAACYAPAECETCKNIYCKRCAMKFATGGRCKMCGNMFASMRRTSKI
jgi:Cof subfamily protein (haloacid dehalogenase superfamily)